MLKHTNGKTKLLRTLRQLLIVFDFIQHCADTCSTSDVVNITDILDRIIHDNTLIEYLIKHSHSSLIPRVLAPSA